VAAVNRDSNSVTVWRYAGGRTFSGASTHAVGPQPRAMAAADFDADGWPDVATMNRDNDSVSLLWNNAGTFAAHQPHALLGDGGNEGLTIVDVDCDALPDLAVLYSDVQAGVLSVLVNHGQREFGIAARFAAPPAGAAVAAGDVDLDGDQDLAVMQEPSGLAVMWNQACIPSLAGDTNCDDRVDFFDVDPFVVAIVTPQVYPQLYPDCDIQRADVNRDSRVDFLDIDPFVARILP
jgi:hypothetical protein